MSKKQLCVRAINRGIRQRSLPNGATSNAISNAMAIMHYRRCAPLQITINRIEMIFCSVFLSFFIWLKVVGTFVVQLVANGACDHKSEALWSLGKPCESQVVMASGPSATNASSEPLNRLPAIRKLPKLSNDRMKIDENGWTHVNTNCVCDSYLQLALIRPIN